MALHPVVFERTKLGHAVDEERNDGSEFLGDLVARHVRVLDRVMQEACSNGRRIHAHFSEGITHRSDMSEVRVS